MILYFSGTGNSAYIAKRIAKETGDPVFSINDSIRQGKVFSDRNQTRLIFVLPTYAWRIPRVVERWILASTFSENAQAYFVMNCGDSIGNAAKYVKKLCEKKGFRCRGCAEIVMPENYIAMFAAPREDEARKIIGRAEKIIDQAAEAVRRYFETGKPVLLLHGGSAAFWPFDWFREAVGLRWVRGNDPDGVVASFHPKEPYRVEPAKCRHPLVSRLIPMDLPQDEIYTALEQTRPMWVLMNTTISSGTFPQCTESTSPWGGRVINFLPGHAATVTRDPALIANVRTLIDSLLA